MSFDVRSTILSNIETLAWVEKTKDWGNTEVAVNEISSMPYNDFLVALGDASFELDPYHPIGWNKYITTYDVILFINKKSNDKDLSKIKEISQLLTHNTLKDGFALAQCADSHVTDISRFETIKENLSINRYCILTYEVIQFEQV